MSRLVTMCWPHWPIRAAGIGEGEPAVVLRGHRVIAVSPSAEDAGITVGLRRREAQARCPGVRVLTEDTDRDARRFEPVVRAIAALVPLVEVSTPGLLTCAARGPSRYFGGDGPLADRLIAAADPSSCGLPADAVVGCGVADGRFASTIAAHRALVTGRPEVVPAGSQATAAFLAPLSLGALSRWGEVDEGLVDLLYRLGVRSLGAFAELPRADVLARFGASGGFAHQLASGDDPRTPDAREPPPDLAVTHWCDDPIVQIEPLVFIGRQLAAGLHRRLADQGAVVTRIVIEAQTEHGETSERQWYRPLGFGVAAIVERIRWQLDGWSRLPGGLSGGVAFLRLSPVEIRADRGMQLGFWGGTSEADEAAARAAARLVGMLGPESVRVPVVHGGRMAHEEVTWLAVGTAEAGVREPGPWPGRLPAPSPAALFEPPTACDVLDAQRQAVRVSGRGEVCAPPGWLRVGGRERQVVEWAGPWPVEQRWWDADGGTRRARFQLVTSDGAAYLVSVERGVWFLDAEFA